MTRNNSILLIIRQFPGIDQNTLLNKINTDYSNINSARAALSRSLRNLIATGLLLKKENKFFVTNKGTASVSKEMKNKLLLNLNELMSKKNAINSFDEIVPQLATLTARVKDDESLLNTAKNTINFSITELESISSMIEFRQNHLIKLNKVLNKEISELKKLGFNDSIKIKQEKAEKTLKQLLNNSNQEEFFIKTNEINLLKLLEKKLNGKIKAGALFLPKNKLEELLKEITSMPRHYYGTIISFEKITAENLTHSWLIQGPYKEINKLKKQ